jgi:uncharacterized protein
MLISAQDQLKEHHRLCEDELRVIYDVNELLVFEVDEIIWEFYERAEAEGLAAAEQHLRERHGDDTTAEIIEELRAMKLIVADPEPPPPESARGGGLKGITLNVVHGCNLACTYCFAQQGDYGLGDKRMSEETAAKAIDWASERRGDNKRINVGFFGGEPMLNMKTIRSAVEHARERGAEHEHGVGFHITTNGTLLTEDNVKYIAENQIGVQVSLDGKPEVNDRFRIYSSGKGSHAQVRKGVERLKKATNRLTLRGTIPGDRPEFGDNVRHMDEDLGATSVAFEPAEIGLADAVDSDEVMARIKAEWTRLAADFEEHAKQGVLKPYGNLVKVMRAIHRRRKVVYGCQAGVSNLAVDPSGDVYPCHRFVGEDDWKVGNIHADTYDDGVIRRFTDNVVDSKEPCRSCWARYTCGGRCAHEAKEATGSISEPDPRLCELVKHLTELALKLYVRLKPMERKLFETGSEAPTFAPS